MPGWYYVPPPQPQVLVPEPQGTTAFGNSPPNPVGAGQVLDDIRSCWPAEQWNAQSAPIIAGQLATPWLSPPFPIPFRNAAVSNKIRANWLVETWPTQVLLTGAALGATVTIVQTPLIGVTAAVNATIRMWPVEQWPAQTGAIVAGRLAIPVNPPSIFPSPPLAAPKALYWPQEAWYAQSECAIAGGIAQTQLPPIYNPSTVVVAGSVFKQWWPPESWPAQSLPPRAGWIPPPVTALPAPLPNVAYRAWLPESWPAQAAPLGAAAFATAPQPQPYLSVAQQLNIVTAWPAEQWGAQRSVKGSGVSSLFAPIPFDASRARAPVANWEQPNWPAQSARPVGFTATVKAVQVPYFTQPKFPISLWLQPSWGAQGPAPAGGVNAIANPPPVPTAGFRVMAVTAGVYGGRYYNPGDVFDIAFAADYSDSTKNYEGGGGEYAPGWMLKVPPNTALFQAASDDAFPTFPAIDPARRFVL